MKKISLIALLAVVVLAVGAVAQQKINLKINIPKEGNSFIVDTLPTRYFQKTMLMVVVRDVQNNIAPENVTVKIKGPNSFFDSFNMTNGAQRNYQNFPKDSIDITISKEGYQTVNRRVLATLPGIIAVRLDKVK